MATKRFLRFFLSFITTKQVFCRHYDSVDLCWIVRFLLHYAQFYWYIVHAILYIYYNTSQYITLFRENIRETHGEPDVHSGRILLHHIHLTADVAGGLLDTQEYLFWQC